MLKRVLGAMLFLAPDLRENLDLPSWTLAGEPAAVCSTSLRRGIILRQMRRLGMEGRGCDSTAPPSSTPAPSGSTSRPERSISSAIPTLRSMR